MRRFDRTLRGHTPSASLRRLLARPAGNFLVNTPLFLLPKKVNLRRKHRVLDLGCGGGANLRFLIARFHFREPPVGLDISRDALGRARADGGADGPRLVAASASRLPFADEAFDLILAGHVLRHLSDEGFMRLLVEANRVLRPGGLLAVWDYAPPADGAAGGIGRWLVDRLGGAGMRRDFYTLAHWASEARYDVIENPDLRPFLFPPVRRVSMLARKPPADAAAPTCENPRAAP